MSSHVAVRRKRELGDVEEPSSSIGRLVVVFFGLALGVVLGGLATLYWVGYLR